MVNQNGDRLYAERGSGGFERTLVVLGHVRRGWRIKKKDGAPDLRCDLLEHLEPLRRHCRDEIGEAGGISPWARQALDKAASYRIGDGSEDDRHRAALLLQGRDRHRTESKDCIRLHGQHFTGNPLFPLGAACSPGFLDLQLAAGLPAEFVEPLAKRAYPSLRFGVTGNSDQHADPPHPLALLRARRERPPAVPPSTVMNSPLFTRSPRPPGPRA